MSVRHAERSAQGHDRFGLTFARPRDWAVWSSPRSVLRYVLAVNAAAVAVIAATATLFPVEQRHLVWFAVLLAGSLVHFEVGKHIERLRELAAEAVPYVHMQSIWTLAGLFLLPPPLIAALIVISYLHLWFRVTQRIPVYRCVFNASTAVLATAAGAAVLAVAVPDSYPGLPGGWTGFAVVVAVVPVRWLVNYALVLGVMLLSAPGTPVRKLVGTWSDHQVEATSLSLGAVAAVLLAHDLPYLLLIAVPVVVVHRSLLVSQSQLATRTDRKTGLLNALFWHELAGKELERAQRTESTAGLVIVDLDRFRAVNERYGPQFGDRVLAAMAGVLRAETRPYDLLGRFGGEEFVLLLPEITGPELGELAERIRLRVHGLTVAGEDGQPLVAPGITVSVGAALYPDSAADLSQLLMAADNALFAAKDAGRDQVVLIGPTHR